MKTLLILPYFGKFPGYFQLYLQSCKYKKNFDWLIITDDLTPYEYPENVKVVIEKFEGIKKLIQSKFDFEISLERPYKLCDYRPAFGYIFQGYLAGYDFWGHADPDCIWGDLDHFITDDLLARFDKLFILGHLTIYRNTEENNTVFMRPLDGVDRYKEVFQLEGIQAFDEAVGNNSINDIYSHYNIPVFENKSRADLCCDYYVLRFVDFESYSIKASIEPDKFQFLEWDKGKLCGISYSFLCLKKYVKEYSYIHFHGTKRMKYEGDGLWDHFYIFRNRFVKYEQQNKFLFILSNYWDYILALSVDKNFLGCRSNLGGLMRFRSYLINIKLK